MGQEARGDRQVILIKLELARSIALTLSVKFLFEYSLILLQEVLEVTVGWIVMEDVTMRC